MCLSYHISLSKWNISSILKLNEHFTKMLIDILVWVSKFNASGSWDMLNLNFTDKKAMKYIIKSFL